eukprot:5285936-Pleurochrysis_carterae.AAC.1
MERASDGQEEGDAQRGERKSEEKRVERDGGREGPRGRERERGRERGRERSDRLRVGKGAHAASRLREQGVGGRACCGLTCVKWRCLKTQRSISYSSESAPCCLNGMKRSAPADCRAELADGSHTV